MRRNSSMVGIALVGGLVVLSSCAGSSTTASPETVGTLPMSTEAQMPISTQGETAETLPALVSASTDIDAIDGPVVLWFWSPG